MTSTPTNTTFGARLKAAMEARGLLSLQLRDIIHKSTGRYYRADGWESKLASIEEITTYATALNVTTDYLLGLSEGMEREDNATTIREFEDLKWDVNRLRDWRKVTINMVDDMEKRLDKLEQPPPPATEATPLSCPFCGGN